MRGKILPLQSVADGSRARVGETRPWLPPPAVAPIPEPPHSETAIVLTAVAVLGCWRWMEFHNNVVRLREAGHVIDVVLESRGVFERRVQR
jgi:hypothetical protein